MEDDAGLGGGGRSRAIKTAASWFMLFGSLVSLQLAWLGRSDEIPMLAFFLLVPTLCLAVSRDNEWSQKPQVLLAHAAFGLVLVAALLAFTTALTGGISQRAIAPIATLSIVGAMAFAGIVAWLWPEWIKRPQVPSGPLGVDDLAPDPNRHSVSRHPARQSSRRRAKRIR